MQYIIFDKPWGEWFSIIELYIFQLSLNDFLLSHEDKTTFLEDGGSTCLENSNISMAFLRFRVKFTIVSEPPEENEDAECEDVGYAFVSLPDILKSGNDLIDKNVPGKAPHVT